MNNRLAIVELNSPKLKGRLAIYDSGSTLHPSYILRAGGMLEPSVPCLEAIPGGGVNVAIIINKTDLSIINANVEKVFHGSTVDTKVWITVVNSCRRALAKYLGKKVWALKFKNVNPIPKRKRLIRVVNGY